jgi:hypothetical protein
MALSILGASKVAKVKAKVKMIAKRIRTRDFILM